MAMVVNIGEIVEGDGVGDVEQRTLAVERESTWKARVTTYGPSSSWTRLVERSRLVFVRWGTSPGTRYRGQGPTSWAHLTARLQGEAERSLADEAAGPLAQLIPIPQDGGDGDEENDPLVTLKADIKAARGKALLVETTAGGFGEGMTAAPRRDWQASRLGPEPPEGMVKISQAAFGRMLAATGTPPVMFDPAAPATALKEGLRQWHLGTVRPMARILEHELGLRLEVEIRLRFDNYPLDLAGRAQAFQKLVAGGVAVNEALVTAGLLDDT